MKVHRWEDIRRKKLGAKQLEENARWVEREIIELNLRALRELTGKTQVEVAKAADMTQPETSRAERREDHLISTLKRYVEGLGGELEVFVRGLRRQAGQAEGRVDRGAICSFRDYTLSSPPQGGAFSALAPCN